jgi:putative N6-adenine-specific DNA methylase
LRHQCFAVCAPGIEHLVVRELDTLGIRRPQPKRGGVTFDATTRQMYAANVWSRTATRVLERVGRFPASDFARLERGARDIPWESWLAPARGVRFRVSATRSRLYHTGAIEERLARIIREHDGEIGADGDETGQLVVVRVASDQVTISVDTTGAPLYKRGWRLAATRASLRETLGAAMLLEAGWAVTTPLVDPFCGSGTIAIEAGLLASGRAPGGNRAFAFEHWPSFEPGTWSSVRADVTAHEQGAISREITTIIASDRDDGAIEIARANAERAGVADALDIRRATVSELAAPTTTNVPGWVITNPPYGRRVSAGSDLRDLFARFGHVARANLPGWNVGMLVADERLAAHARLALTVRFRTDNGGIPVRYLTGPVAVAS